MNSDLQQRMDAVIARHDLLTHPFYQAWSAGKLTAEDLRRYASEYYHHVAAFPAYLSAMHSRLPDGEMRRAVLRNLCEEEITGAPHSELWLDFAEGMGADRAAVRNGAPSKSTQQLIATFRRLATQKPLAALGAFYAYESQVARIADVKAQGLKEWYGADAKTCNYFVQHSTQDAHHARVWAKQIQNGLSSGDDSSEEAILAAVDDAATALWKSLDGIHQPCEATSANEAKNASAAACD